MKKWRKILSFLLALALASSTITAPLPTDLAVYAATTAPTEPVSGTIEGTDIQWDVAEDTVKWDLSQGKAFRLTLSGSGSIPDFGEDADAPWQDQMYDIQTIETEGITGIGNESFLDAVNLLRMEADRNISNIGSLAFANCSKMRYMTIPTAEIIGTAAFQNDAAIQNNLVLEKAAQIGAGAFQGCALIESAFLGGKLNAIEESVFADCGALCNIMIPETVTSVGEQAFAGCVSLRTINIPAAVTAICVQAFAGDAMLEKVYFYGGIPAEWAEDSFSDTNSNLTLYYRAAQNAWETQGGRIYL